MVELNCTCTACGKKFHVSPSRVKSGRGRYCSRRCKDKAQRGENAPNWRGGPVKRICEVCSKEFYITRAKTMGGKGRFCSNECRCIALSGENHPNWRGTNCACEVCGKEFYMNPAHIKRGQGRFCSRKCMGIAYSGENGPCWKGPNCTCEVCGKEFYAKPSWIAKGRGRFCSHKCRAIAMSGENSPCWRGGIRFLLYPPEFNEVLKEQVREGQNHQCFICQLPDKNRKTLAVHHIDYDKVNNDPGNLVALCSSCHGATGTNREYWTAHLRKQTAQHVMGVHKRFVG